MSCTILSVKVLVETYRSWQIKLYEDVLVSLSRWHIPDFPDETWGVASGTLKPLSKIGARPVSTGALNRLSSLLSKSSKCFADGDFIRNKLHYPSKILQINRFLYETYKSCEIIVGVRNSWRWWSWWFWRILCWNPCCCIK